MLTLNEAKHDGKSFSLVNFLYELHNHIYDTYLVVTIGLDEIIQGNLVIKETNLIEQLHFAIIDLHADNMLPSLQSCLQQTIKTALHRFAKLGYIELQTYRLENGSRISYVSGSQEQLGQVQSIQEELMQLQSYQPAVIQEIGKRVQTGLQEALVTHLTSRL